jgi:hypothetical protein
MLTLYISLVKIVLHAPVHDQLGGTWGSRQRFWPPSSGRHGRCLVVSQSLKTIDLGINVHLGTLMRSCRHFCMDSSRSFSKTMTDVQSQGRWNSLAASGGGASANSLEVHPPLKQLLIVEDMDCGC